MTLEKKIGKWREGSMMFWEIEPFIDKLIEELELREDWDKADQSLKFRKVNQK